MRSASPTSSIAIYLASSLFASLIGRLVVTRFFFDYPVVILLLQNATILFFVEVLRVLNFIKIAPYTIERGRHLMLSSFLFCIAQWLTIASFEGIGLPNFEAFKRFTPLAILGAYAIFHHQRVDKTVVGSVAALCLVAFITVNLELDADRFSLFYGLLSCVFQAVAFVTFEQLSQNIPAIEMLYLHSFNSLVIFLVADIVQDEIRDAFMYMMTSSHPLFYFVFALMMFSALPLMYSTFLCIEKNGALNTQIVSNIRSCVQIFIAYFCSIYLFYDSSPGTLNYLGLLAVFPVAYYYFLARHQDTPPAKMPWVVNKA